MEAQAQHTKLTLLGCKVGGGLAALHLLLLLAVPLLLSTLLLLPLPLLLAASPASLFLLGAL
jgi:hypothetical protein